MLFVLSYLISEKCYPKDSDACLSASPTLASTTCAVAVAKDNGFWCLQYGKNLRRCCPEACKTGTFTEADCNSFPGIGVCTYPNDAQCLENG